MAYKSYDNGARPFINFDFVAPIIPINTNARFNYLDQVMYADQAAFHQKIKDDMEAEAAGEEASKESATNGNSSGNSAPTNSSSSAAGNGAQAKSGESDEQSTEDEGCKNCPVSPFTVLDESTINNTKDMTVLFDEQLKRT